MDAKQLEQLAAMIAQTTTPTLIESLRKLEHSVTTSPTPELRLSRAWTIEELERRFPAASEAVSQAFLDDERRVETGAERTEVNYVAVLLSNIEQPADEN
jgi:hypothetical protein